MYYKYVCQGTVIHTLCMRTQFYIHIAFSLVEITLTLNEYVIKCQLSARGYMQLTMGAVYACGTAGVA